MNYYDLNSLISITVAFNRVDNGQPIDPGEVTLSIRQPDCTLVVYSYSAGDVQRDDVGNYHMEIDGTIAGHWKYKWEGTYPVEAGSIDGEFIVKSSSLVGSRWPTGGNIAAIASLVAVA